MGGKRKQVSKRFPDARAQDSALPDGSDAPPAAPAKRKKSTKSTPHSTKEQADGMFDPDSLAAKMRGIFGDKASFPTSSTGSSSSNSSTPSVPTPGSLMDSLTRMAPFPHIVTGAWDGIEDPYDTSLTHNVHTRAAFGDAGDDAMTKRVGGGYSGGSSSASTTGWDKDRMDIYVVLKDGSMGGPYTVPDSDWDFWEVAKSVYPAADGKMYVPEDRVTYIYDTPSFNACTYEASKNYLEAIWGRKLDSTDKDWLALHPLSKDSGVPAEYTAICLQELVAPYNFGISRMRVRKGLVVMSDEDRQFALALGCNPMGYADHQTDNAQFVELMKQQGVELTLEQVNAQFRFEFSDIPLAPCVICEAGWSNSTTVQTGFAGGHARYLAPRGKAGDWKVSLQFAPLDKITYASPIVFPKYEERKGRARLTLTDGIRRLDGKPVAVKLGGWWYSPEEAADRQANPSKYKNNGYTSGGSGGRRRIPSTQEEIDKAKAEGTYDPPSGNSSSSSQTASGSSSGSNASSGSSDSKKSHFYVSSSSIAPHAAYVPAHSRIEHYFANTGTAIIEPAGGGVIAVRWISGTHVFREGWMFIKQSVTSDTGYVIQYRPEMDGEWTNVIKEGSSHAVAKYYFQTLNLTGMISGGTPSGVVEAGAPSAARVRCTVGNHEVFIPTALVDGSTCCVLHWEDAFKGYTCPRCKTAFTPGHMPKLLSRDAAGGRSYFACADAKCDAKIMVDEKDPKHREAFPELVRLSEACYDSVQFAEAQRAAQADGGAGTSSQADGAPETRVVPRNLSEWNGSDLLAFLADSDTDTVEGLAQLWGFTSPASLVRYAQDRALNEPKPTGTSLTKPAAAASKPTTPAAPQTPALTVAELDALAASLNDRWHGMTMDERRAVSVRAKYTFLDVIQDFFATPSVEDRAKFKAAFGLPPLEQFKTHIDAVLALRAPAPTVAQPIEPATAQPIAPAVEAVVETAVETPVAPAPEPTPTTQA